MFFIFIFMMDFLLLNSLVKNINFPNWKSVFFRNIKFACRSRNYIIGEDCIISLEFSGHRNWNDDNNCSHKLCVNKLLRTDCGFNNDIGKVSNSIVSFFQGVLSQLSLGFGKSTNSGSQLRLKVSKFCLNDFSNSWESIAPWVFWVIPAKVIQIFWHCVLLITRFDIPVMGEFIL